MSQFAEPSHPQGASLTFRPIDAVADGEFIWHMVFLASRSHEQPGETTVTIRDNFELFCHFGDWGLPGDFGLVAELDGSPVGAAWVRLLPPEPHQEGWFIDAETPELVMAVAPQHQGQGYGEPLLAELLRCCDDLYPAVMLTARDASKAIGLYQRHGFVHVKTIVNRVGGSSVVMVRKAAAAT